MNNRKDKVANFIKEMTANFLARENNNTSLITITAASCSPDLKRATVYFTVLPVTKETEALNFLKRKGKDLREFLKKNMTTKSVPFIDFVIDLGEKNRQKIDELLLEK